MLKTKAHYLFEISFEVCNKVGGIYTVLSSKAKDLLKHYQKNYFLIGPYFPEKIKGEFKEEKEKKFEKIFEELKKEGIICHLGSWLIEGKPKVILIDFQNFLKEGNEIKKELWETYQIDSLNAPFDYTEPLVWAWTTGKLLEKINSFLKGEKIVAHFHEWLSGAGLLYLKKNKIPIATIFTTHATILGRTLANNHLPLYDILEKINPYEEAKKYNIVAKYQLEKKSAKLSDVFTALSEINGLETEKFLERKPDFYLPNGLNVDNFPSLEEILVNHKIFRSRLNDFLFSFFAPYYPIDLKNSLVYFIACRYEFHNKGIDIFLKALGRLNKKLKEKKQSKTIFAFLWVPSEIKGIKPEVWQSIENYRDIVDSLKDFSFQIEENFVASLLNKKGQVFKHILDKKLATLLEKKVLKFKREGLPPLSTHDVTNQEDIIIKTLREENLENKPNDKVKVIFCPFYLTGDDGLINLDYYESIQATDLGVFPSYYEPWGYTPLEAAILAVPAIGSDLAGSGQFLNSFLKEKKDSGIFILKRFKKSDQEATDSLFEILYRFQKFSKTDLSNQKIGARKLAEIFDWKNLISNYLNAHNKALRRIL